MDLDELKKIVEVLLLSVDNPLDLNTLQKAFEGEFIPDKDTLRRAINLLSDEYSSRGIELIEVASGYRIQTKKEFSIWASRLQFEKPAKYSRALLETLAIIAYKQPVTRADIEELRGVHVNTNALKTLLEREWIRIAGYKDVPGKPAVYVTTKHFLNYFNLKTLNELPVLNQIADSLTLNKPEPE